MFAQLGPAGGSRLRALLEARPGRPAGDAGVPPSGSPSGTPTRDPCLRWSPNRQALPTYIGSGP